MFEPRNETEDLLFSKTENCELLINQTYKKADETTIFQLSGSKESFSFNPPIQIEGSWTIGSVNLQIYISIFNITEESKKFKLYPEKIQNPEKITFEKSEELIEENLGVSYIDNDYLLDKEIEAVIIEEKRKTYSEKKNEDGHINLLNG